MKEMDLPKLKPRLRILRHEKAKILHLISSQKIIL